MNKQTRTQLDNIRASDGNVQFEAYNALLAQTNNPVDWAYEAWDELLEGLTHPDNHIRAIAGQLLPNLAKSDPKNRILKDLDKLVAVTKDKRFVTARHTMQSLWKVGVLSKKHQKAYMAALAQRFHECATEKNCTLIRYDIMVSFRNVYDVTKDEAIRKKALELIDTEPDEKYRKKYATVWKAKGK